MFWCRTAFSQSLQLSLVQISFIYNALAVVPTGPCFSVPFSFVHLPKHWVRLGRLHFLLPGWILAGGTLSGLSLGVSALQPVSWLLCGVLWGWFALQAAAPLFFVNARVRSEPWLRLSLRGCCWGTSRASGLCGHPRPLISVIYS